MNLHRYLPIFGVIPIWFEVASAANNTQNSQTELRKISASKLSISFEDRMIRQSHTLIYKLSVEEGSDVPDGVCKYRMTGKMHTSPSDQGFPNGTQEGEFSMNGKRPIEVQYKISVGWGDVNPRFSSTIFLRCPGDKVAPGSWARREHFPASW